MPRLAKTEDSLLRPAPLFVTPGPTDCGVESIAVDARAQGHSLHDPGVLMGTVGERRDALVAGLLIRRYAHVQAKVGHALIAERDHLLELPGGVDMHHRERQTRRRKGLERKVQKHGGILADAVEQHWIPERSCGLAVDVDSLGLKLVENGLIGNAGYGHASLRTSMPVSLGASARAMLPSPNRGS